MTTQLSGHQIAYGVIERASGPLVGFGVLIDNTIKGLTCLYEIMSMSKDLTQDVILNKVTHVLQENVYIPLAFIYVCDKQNWEQGIYGWYKGSNKYIKACLTYDGIQMIRQGYENETWVCFCIVSN